MWNRGVFITSPFRRERGGPAGDGAGLALAAFAVEQPLDEGVALAFLGLLGELVLGLLGLLLLLLSL